jgi:hypothetical protein
MVDTYDYDRNPDLYRDRESSREDRPRRTLSMRVAEERQRRKPSNSLSDLLALKYRRHRPRRRLRES